jgi:hypothetical protein
VIGVSKRSAVLLAMACAVVLVPLGAHATSSGPNGRIVFVDNSTRIAVATNDFVTVHTDTDPGALGATSPSWSPASQRIAYVQSGSIKIVTYNSTSGAFGAPTTVTGTTGTIQSVAWSPNGATLAYSNGIDIRTIAVGGTGDQPLTFASGTVTNTDPAWSPDGTRLAFAKGSGTNSQIYTMNSGDGSAQTRITSSISADSQPNWSPDGTKLAFTSNRDGHGQIYTVLAGGGSETRLTNETTVDADGTWSPDGSKLALEHGSNVQTMSASGGNPGAGGVAGTDPDWGLLFGPLTPPTISPSSGLSVGTVLTASNGTWSATPQSFAYQWQRCNSSGGSCSAISGATDPTYTLTAADDGFTFRVTVTATVSSGSGSSTSPATAVFQQTFSVAGQPPSVVEVPTVTTTPPVGETPPAGTVLVGSTMSAGIGTWRGQFPISFAYQWKRCNATGPCFAIPGAISSSFTPTFDLNGWRIAVGVIASNTLGKAEATSLPTPPLALLAPRGSITPPITGSNVVGQTLSVTTGTFTGTTPFTFAYQWRRCDAAGALASCTPIPGATSASYILTQADFGATLRVYVTATNAAGSDTVITNHTFPTLPKPKFSPSAADAPRILGRALLGYRLTVDVGNWTGDAPITFTRKWQRCDATGAGCAQVSTTRSYLVTKNDLSARLRVVVTAKNDNGTVSTTTGLTDPIQLTPHRKGRRIVGTAKADYLAGGGFDDTIFGLGGNDTVLGGSGADRLDGGAGGDILVGGSGSDTFFGGVGSDTIMAADGERDVVDCGPGSDRTVVDAIDVVSNCESVQIVGDTSSSTTSSTTTTTTSPTTTARSTTSTTTTPTTTARP